MVNTNVQGVIPIEGPGYVAKLKRDYNAGEYRELSNCELRDGIIKNRNSIEAYSPDATAPLVSSYPFIGFIDDYVITASKTEHWRFRPNSNPVAVSWNPTSLPVPAAAGSFHKIVGVFEYNARVYWLTWQVDGDTSFSTFYLYHATHSGFTLAYNTVFANLTVANIFSINNHGVVFDNFFIYKERLWVVTSQGMYFSKVADPTNFTAPDGGFVKLRDQNINYAFPVRDGIYLLCDTSIHYFTYNTDPNADAYMKEVSNSVGADHGVQHNDTAYVINSNGLYSVSGSSIDLVKSDFQVSHEFTTSKLVSWDEYLIILKTDRHQYTSIGNALWPAPFADVGNTYANGNYGLDHNVFFINMNTGTTHTLDFFDQFVDSIAQPTDRGNVTDLVVNPTKDFYRVSGLTIMTNKCSGAANAPGSAHVYRMDKGKYFIYDRVFKTDNTLIRVKPNINIIFDSFAPDGNEYMMKKFRNLLAMGHFPYSDFEVAIAYDNRDYPALGNGVLLINDSNSLDDSGEARGHFPARIGLNQRARSISLNFRTRNPLTTLVNPNIWEQFELSDLRVLWSYTSRAVNTKTPTLTT